MKAGGRSQPRTPYATEFRNKRGLAQTIRDTGQRLRRVELKDVPAGLADLIVSIQKNGALIGSQPILNFIQGSNVTLTMDDDGQVVNIEIAANITGTAGSGYNTIQDEGVPLAQQPIMDFVGAGVTATPGAGKTIVTIPGGSATEGGLIHYDYIVDAAYAGANGDVVTLKSGQTAIMYKTIQLAVTAADAANAAKTIFINGGTYAESVVIPATFGTGHNLTFIGEGREKVTWGATTGTALTISGNNPIYRFKGITFRGAVGTNSVVGTVSLISATFEDCKFNRGVSAQWVGTYFLNCHFAGGYQVSAADAPATVLFALCEFNGISLWSNGVIRHEFVNCWWPSSTDVIQMNGTPSFEAFFTGCIFGTSGGSKTMIDLINGAATLTFNGCFFPGPGANGSIYVEAGADPNVTIQVNGCYFEKQLTNPYIKFARAGRLIASGNWFEDNGSIDITGIFVNSTFGPNFPPDTNVQLDAGSATCMYIGTGTVSGTNALNAVVPLVQRGSGVPVHTAPEGTPYWDTAANALYINNDGATGWTAIAGGGAGALGPQGPPGIDGEDGEDGPPGPAGATGAAGAIGAQGAASAVMGPPGTDGEDGEPIPMLGVVGAPVIRYIQIRVLDSATSHTVATIGGDFVMPFACSLTTPAIAGVALSSIGVTVDTAGTTGAGTIDIKKNGTSIFSTLITLDTTEKTSRTAAAVPVLTNALTTFAVGDILTFNITVIHTTPAKGLTIWLNVSA